MKKEFYIIFPEEINSLYNENDDCLEGWIDNAIKLNEKGNPILIDEKTMPIMHDWFPIAGYIQPAEYDACLMRRGVEAEGDPNIEYSFSIFPANEEFVDYNPKTGILSINEFDKGLKELFAGDFDDYVFGTSYIRVMQNKRFWTDALEIDPFRDSENSLSKFIRYDPCYVKILKRKNQDERTDT